MEPVSSTELNERLAYSVDEAAAITGLSRDLLYDQMRAGKLAYLKVGRPHHHPPAPRSLPYPHRLTVRLRKRGAAHGRQADALSRRQHVS